MRTPFRAILAAGLLVLSGIVVSGQACARDVSGAAQRNNQEIQQSYSYESYGLGSVCSSRPYAPGCDKRGFW